MNLQSLAELIIQEIPQLFDQKLCLDEHAKIAQKVGFELDEEEAKEYFQHMAEDAGKEYDSTSITGPMTIYQIKGLGAEIKM